MKKLPARIKRKKEIWKIYFDNLKHLKEVKLFNHDLKFTSPWFIDCLVEDRSQLMKYLKENNIGTRVMYPPINEQNAYNQKGNYPICKQVDVKGLWLPSYVQLSNQEILYITSKINDYYR